MSTSLSTLLIDEFRARILARQPIRIRGGGSKDFYGGPLLGEVLDTRGNAGILNYEPSELVLTARAGTPLSEITAALAKRQQCLAFEPPFFGDTATLGGVIASGLAGPRRQSAGAVRDYVLGATLMDGEGRVLKFGGEVMKNVAGFDVSRLLAGSLGTLGILLDVSLKVLPVPVCERTVVLTLDETEALHALNRWAGQPLPIAATCWHAGQLHVRLAGAQAAVAAAEKELPKVSRCDTADNALWPELREQSHAFFAGTAPLWRIALPSTAPALHLGPTLIEWGGGQRWLRGDLDAGQLRRSVQALGGHATLFRGGDKNVGVFQPLAPALLQLHQAVKARFDPHGVFNRTRLYREF